MEHFNNTVIQKNERYQVVWSWKNEDINLPENYELSYGRLKSLHEQIFEVPKIIKYPRKNSIIGRVSEKSEQRGRKKYIPHHAVFRSFRKNEENKFKIT